MARPEKYSDEQIITAFTEMAADKGFAKISVVAKSLGMSPDHLALRMRQLQEKKAISPELLQSWMSPKSRARFNDGTMPKNFKTSIVFTPENTEWLKAQGHPISEIVNGLVTKARRG